jgi:hypothetical protein
MPAQSEDQEISGLAAELTASSSGPKIEFCKQKQKYDAVLSHHFSQRAVLEGPEEQGSMHPAV